MAFQIMFALRAKDSFFKVHTQKITIATTVVVEVIVINKSALTFKN